MVCTSDVHTVNGGMPVADAVTLGQEAVSVVATLPPDASRGESAANRGVLSREAFPACGSARRSRAKLCHHIAPTECFHNAVAGVVTDRRPSPPLAVLGLSEVPPVLGESPCRGKDSSGAGVPQDTAGRRSRLRGVCGHLRPRASLILKEPLTHLHCIDIEHLSTLEGVPRDEQPGDEHADDRRRIRGAARG